MACRRTRGRWPLLGSTRPIRTPDQTFRSPGRRPRDRRQLKVSWLMQEKKPPPRSPREGPLPARSAGVFGRQEGGCGDTCFRRFRSKAVRDFFLSNGCCRRLCRCVSAKGNVTTRKCSLGMHFGAPFGRLQGDLVAAKGCFQSGWRPSAAITSGSPPHHRGEIHQTLTFRVSRAFVPLKRN